jgi:hypothetical protein
MSELVNPYDRSPDQATYLQNAQLEQSHQMQAQVSMQPNRDLLHLGQQNP